MTNRTKLIAFDLDGTLTQHKSPLSAESRALLDRLSQKYRLLMVGAGACMRIHLQMERYPIDIIGNYGMQSSRFDPATGALDVYEDVVMPVDRALICGRVAALRARLGFERFAGDSVEFHASGMITFPLLGTAANLADKLRFDPDRSKRKPLYKTVREYFPEYTTFIGGSSSFDIVPFPFNKRYALEKHCGLSGLALDEVVFVGDDYGVGGNDEDVYRSGIRFVTVDDYRTVAERLSDF